MEDSVLSEVEIARPEYTEQLLRYRGDGRVKILTGLRRVGKSYLLRRLFRSELLRRGVGEDHIVSVNLEDIHEAELCHGLELLQHVEGRIRDKQRHYILIDEAQRAERFWEQLATLALRREVDVYVTGSNSRYLTTRVESDFRGRGRSIDVRPMTFANVQEYLGERNSYAAWQTYSSFGGMPELQKEHDTPGRQHYLTSLYDTVYRRDLVERFDVEHVAAMQMLLRYIASTTGSLVSPARIAGMFLSRGHAFMTVELVNEYLDYFQEAMLLQKAQRYDIRGQQHLDSVEKYYFSDHGLRNAIVGFQERNLGANLETIVYNELRRQGYAVSVGVVAPRPLPYDEEPEGKMRTCEVDFVASDASRSLYIQCVHDMPSPTQERRELRPFQLIKDFRKRVLITGQWLANTGYDREGILRVPIMDLLLKPHILEF